MKHTPAPGAVLMLLAVAHTAGVASERPATVILRAWGVPEIARVDVESFATRQIIEAFEQRFPHIKPVAPTGIEIPGRDTKDMQTLMQIAGDIPQHVMYVNFRQSDTYIRSKFLCALDRDIEQLAGVSMKNGHLMDLDAYLAELRKGPNYAREIADRVPYQCWKVMRRECPYGLECPHLRKWGEAPAARHQHTWCFPVGPDFIALFYRKDLLLEAGLPDRVPETIEEMLQWCRKLTNPRDNRYGLEINLGELGWSTLSFLYSLGGRVVDQDAEGNWHCVFDSEEAVEAYYQVARFFLEPFENQYGRWTGVVYVGDPRLAREMKIAMFFQYLDQRFFANYDPVQYGFGPVPKGPTGLRGAEFNARMVGIYAGIDDQPELRRAAWEYVRFYDGPEARLIRTRALVENGMGMYVRPKLLEEAGYHDYVRLVPRGWEEAATIALQTGIPEPYGRNCQQVYTYVSKAIDQIRVDDVVRRALAGGDAAGAKNRIREILRARVKRSNERMLNILSPEERAFRNRVALIVAAVIFIIFGFVFHRVFKVFARSQLADPVRYRGGWQFTRYKWAYIILLPALISIALWEYWPIVRGTVIAFQDYNVRGFSRWVGVENFANVLFDDEFWHSMWVSLCYMVLFVLFGFGAPIVLAFLLTEIPRGKVLLRVVYFLPAVLAGPVVMFLWKSFYSPYGMINEVLNFFVALLNLIPGVNIAEVRTAWLESPRFVLFFCLLPTIWAGMGPGCLLYLAALKTIPDEIYEAADIDGAGIWQKIRHISLPGIKALIMINFVGAIIGAMKGGAGFILAMTGGGPYTPYGQSEVVGLHIFWQAFAYLRFGPATAMAWVLGAMLIGFTVVQLQRISRMEFRTVTGTK